ncbi:MAG: NUDIX hydrolase [Candidatus Marinimicrobia bacterium]|nr:NUDIX hydrolase [Candidatus Neomarinimicrobiota bacterium]MBL7030957.1 NUDIX hydrolase [Candidatus Neomarinimicrobiota bacterium]
MKRQPLKQLLIKYKNKHPDQLSVVKTSIQFLDSTPLCFNRNNLYGHFTGSAWVIDETREWVLMTHHRQLNQWLQLGGHADGCSNLLTVALEEAKEESGLTDFRVLSQDIFDLDVHHIPQYKDVPSHLHFDIRFILECQHGTDNIVVSDESHDVAWIHKNDVLNKNSEESMVRMLKKTLVNFAL